MINNIKEIRKKRGLTQTQVSKLAGLNQSTYQRVESGEIALTQKYMELLSEVFCCMPSDLIANKNEFTSDKNDAVTIDVISATPCCGNGNECSEDVIGKWIMPLQDFKRLTQTSPDRVKQMQVSGDSMQPTINDGDFILADTSRNVFDVDGIYLIRMINGLVVKRLQAGLNAISIISDNPNYKPIEASIGEVKIIGKVIKILNVRSV